MLDCKFRFCEQSGATVNTLSKENLKHCVIKAATHNESAFAEQL